MLTGADGLQLIQIDQQVVGQCHLFIELVRQIQMVQIVLAQMQGQQAVSEGGLATSLGSY